MDFRRLVAPVFIAVVISVAAFVAVVVVAADRQDEIAYQTEKSVLLQEIRSVHENLRVLAEDNAWWDVAYRKVVIEEDIDWIDRTMGDSITNARNIQGVMVLRPDGSMIYSGVLSGLPGPHSFFEGGMDTFAQTLPQPEGIEPTSDGGILLADDELVAFGASTVQTTGIHDFTEADLARPRPVIIFYARLDSRRLRELGDVNAIADFRFERENSSDNAVPITQFDGKAIGYLNWTPSAPGSDMVEIVMLPAALLLLVVVFAMARFVRRANQLVVALEDANQAKSAFLASTSHEIRTPLNSILGFTEMISLELYGKVEGEKNREYLTLIKDSGQHLLSIINDILDISKLEAGRFELFTEKVDPVLVVNSSCKIVKPSAQEKDIAVTADCAAADLACDERVMRQVLINLLSNAVKFTEPGGTVTITGRSLPDAYEIVVKDTGVGMTDAEVKTALSLFGQVQNRMVRKHGGTGLGLPLVCRFMERLGGTFEVESTPGVGTKVTLTFPLYTGMPQPN